MKNVKKLMLRFSGLFFTTIALFLLSSALSAQIEYSDVIKFETDFNPTGTVEFTNRSYDVEIRTWDNSSVELQIQVKIRAKDQEDVDATLEAIRNIDFKAFGEKLIINTLFWESMTCNVNQKLKLKTGKKAVLKSFDIQIALFVPKTISMEIDSKYADIKMEEIAGSADIKMYNGKLYGQSFGGAVDFDMRYSKAFLANIPEAIIVLYDSDIELESCGNLSVESKYSKIEIIRAGDIDFKSFDDNFAIGKLGEVSGEAKYTDFDFGPSINLTFDFYDCNLKGGDTGKIKGKSKYSEIKVGNAETVVLSSSFDDDFVFGEIASLECSESKYSDFDIQTLAELFKLVSYDDNVSIENISPDFSQINIDGKYGDYRLTIPESASYQLLVDMKYGKVDYPEEMFDRKTYIKENSTVFMDATTKNTQGKALRVVEVKGHDNAVVIRN